MKNAHVPWLASFGRRRGKGFSAKSQIVFTQLQQQSSLILPALPDGKRDLSAIFPTHTAAPWLEIGFGGGEHLAAQAEAHPTIPMIGCEPYLDGVVQLLKKIQARHLSNIRLWHEDVRYLFAQLEDHILARVFILFPDPWPKKKHHKRRLISPSFLDMLAEKMQSGAELRIATDDEAYAAEIAVHVRQHPLFIWDVPSQNDWRNPPPDWIETRYQQKAQARGKPPFFFRCIHK